MTRSATIRRNEIKLSVDSELLELRSAAVS